MTIHIPFEIKSAAYRGVEYQKSKVIKSDQPGFVCSLNQPLLSPTARRVVHCREPGDPKRPRGGGVGGRPWNPVSFHFTPAVPQTGRRP